MKLSVDWDAPWWSPWRQAGQRLQSTINGGAAVHEALNSLSNSTVRFVPQNVLPQTTAYEAYIFETQTVPTRDNLHDFFNGLVWHGFPRTKAQLNALQYAQIQRDGVGQQRGAVRDALTLFDENAAFLSATLHAPVIDALRPRDWASVFQTHRELLRNHPPVLFGHALLEKLVSPYKSITAHVFAVQCSALEYGDLAQLDSRVAEQLTPTALVPKPFVPLPVLGVPKWCDTNEHPEFYQDQTVFRLPRVLS